MVMRDSILAIEHQIIEDGMGGFITSSILKKTAIDCKVSISNDVAFANQYGVATDDILIVVSTIPLTEEVVYEHNGKRYKCRSCREQRRFFYSTLVGIKQ